MTTFETNTKVVHNSLVQNLHQRSIISFISNCFFSLDGSSFLKKILHSSIYPLTTPISIFLWKSPEPPWRFVTLIISWLKICMFFFQVQIGIVITHVVELNFERSFITLNVEFLMKWKVLCMQQTIWIIFIKILFPGRTYRTSKWWQCLASGIKWFPDMDTRPLYLQPEKYQHQVFADADCPLPPIIQR